MARRISDRVDDLLELVLSLKRDLAEAGHRVDEATPNFVRHIATAPEVLGPQPLGQPYEEIAPGLTIGFLQGAKPDLHLRSTPEGALEIVLRQRTSSSWISLEIDWKEAAFLEKRKATLMLRGTSPGSLVLNCVLRRIGADGTGADIPGATMALGPEPAFHVVEFADPGDRSPGPHTYRAIVFCPVQPFAMTLTELSLR
jgi:hypothetical protein